MRSIDGFEGKYPRVEDSPIEVLVILPLTRVRRSRRKHQTTRQSKSNGAEATKRLLNERGFCYGRADLPIALKQLSRDLAIAIAVEGHACMGRPNPTLPSQIHNNTAPLSVSSQSLPTPGLPSLRRRDRRVRLLVHVQVEQPLRLCVRFEVKLSVRPLLESTTVGCSGPHTTLSLGSKRTDSVTPRASSTATLAASKRRAIFFMAFSSDFCFTLASSVGALGCRWVVAEGQGLVDVTESIQPNMRRPD